MASIWEPGSLIVCQGTQDDPCNWAALTELVAALIQFMVVISTFLAAAVFVYIGIKLLTSGGNESAVTDAKKMFGKVVKGYLWILFAWIVVYTITNTLLKDGYTLLSR